MLTAKLKVVTGVLLGRSLISSRGNCLLPPTAKYLVHRSLVCASTVGLTLAEPLPLCQTRPKLVYEYVQRVGIHIQLGLRQFFLHFTLGSRHSCSNHNYIVTMPALKKTHRSGSFRDLILRKKKNKNKKDEETVDGDQVVEEAVNEDEPTSPVSTNSDVASPDADAEAENPENGTKDKEEEEEEEKEEAADKEEAEPEEETPAAAAEPEIEDEPASPDGEVTLETVVTKLEKFAPLSLAADWDNVGLLVEPTSASVVKKIFLTNDLTEKVLEEAIESEANFILSYHPPIFSPLKRLTLKSEKERIVIKALEKGIAIYSPHTAHDAARGGVNDWLISAFGNRDASPIIRSSNAESQKFKLEIAVIKQFKQKVQQLFTADNGSLSKVVKTGDGLYHFKAVCDEATVDSIFSSLDEQKVKRSSQLIKLSPDPCNDTGMGRLVTLLEPFSLETCIAKVKAHLDLEHVQLALGDGKTLESSIETIAACAGSCSGALQEIKADLYLTGEMSHHNVLAAVSKGTSVITCNHSNTERGFLKVLKEKLELWLGDNVPVQISEVDADPLKVV